MNSKTELRQLFRARLGEAAGSNEFVRSCETLSGRLEKFLQKTIARGGGIWAAFQPTGFEPDVRSLFERPGARTDGATTEWAFPRVEGEALSFYVPEPSASFVLNRWGILEPDPVRARPVSLDEIAGLLVPGLAFDMNCNRLGRGGGFYDRFLAGLLKSTPETHPTPLKVGVALDLQVSEREFSVDPHDVPMDWVVTESRTLERRSPGHPERTDAKSERKTS